MPVIKSFIELAIAPILVIPMAIIKIVEHQRVKDSNALDLDKIILNN